MPRALDRLVAIAGISVMIIAAYDSVDPATRKRLRMAWHRHVMITARYWAVTAGLVALRAEYRYTREASS